MTEIVGSLAFLIVLDLTVLATMVVSWRLTRVRFMAFGSLAMALETSRQGISAIITAAPNVAALPFLSSVVDFASAAVLCATAAAIVEKRVRPGWYVLAAATYVVTLTAPIALGLSVLLIWLLANVSPIGLHLGAIAILWRDARQRSFGILWLMGLFALSIAFRLSMPFAVVTSDTLFGVAYLLDSFVFTLLGCAVYLISFERMAEHLQKEKDATQEAGELLNTILRTAYDAVVVCDTHGTIVSWNRSAEHTFGWTSADAVGRPIGDCIPGIAFDNRNLPGVSFRERDRLTTRTRTGEELIVEQSTFAIERRGERRFVAIVCDITERVQLDAEMRAMEERVRHAQRLDSLGVFAGGIAHDYNNVLAAIMGFADVGCNESPEGSAQRQYFEEILNAAERGSDLTQQILAYAGKTQATRSAVDLPWEIDAMLPLLHTVVSKKARIETRFGAKLPPILADKYQVGQVIVNLVSNASNALDDKAGTITIACDEIDATSADLTPLLFGHELLPGVYVRLRVTDSGHGMSRDRVARVFDPFFTTSPTGRGLGLATVSAIVRAHNGGIYVESESGSGTTFTVFFPRSDEAGLPLTTDSPRVPGKDKTAAAPARTTILVVDDEEAVRKAASMILARAGFEVLLANDGRESLDVLDRHADIRLVLLDCNMPRMGGAETLNEIASRRWDLPILLSSGKSRTQDTQGYAGPVEFIQKPYRAADLVSRINAMLGNRSTDAHTLSPSVRF